MADNKKSFILYRDILSMVSKMPDDAAGKLFKHILEYVNDNNPEEPEDLLVSIAFEPIKQQLKRDLEKYKSIIDRSKANGKKGGRPKTTKTQENPEVNLGYPENPEVNLETQNNLENPAGYLGFSKEPRKAVNVTDTDTDNEKNKDKHLSRNSTTTAVDNVFNFWKSATSSPRARLDDKRKKIIRNSLKIFSEEELKLAISGCTKTPHNMGQNDRGQKYLGLHVIFRDADQVERFIKNHHSPPKSTGGVANAQSIIDDFVGDSDPILGEVSASG